MLSGAEQPPSPITLNTFSPAQTPELVAFLNRVLPGHRHWTPISETDFAARVLDRPGFDPGGLLLARAGDRVVGGVHAIRPGASLPLHAGTGSRHHIVWLAVEPAFRGGGVGSRLLRAAENYLYYCPVYFAAQPAPDK